jgi:transposase
MGLADAHGRPLAVAVASASPHEVTLVEPTLQNRFVAERPERLIGDMAYDSDPLDEQLAAEGIEMIAPHRRNRQKPATQDGRCLRRYRRRWKIERLWAWLQNYRRILVRHERYAANYLGFVLLGCILILLKSGL